MTIRWKYATAGLLLTACSWASATAIVQSSIISRYATSDYIALTPITTDPFLAAQTLTIRGATSTGTVDTSGGFLKSFSAAPRPVSEGDFEKYLYVSTSATLQDSVRFGGTTSFSGNLQITFIGQLNISDFIGINPPDRSFARGAIGANWNYGGAAYTKAIGIASDCQASSPPDCVLSNSTRTELLVPFSVTAFSREVNFQLTLNTQAYLDAASNFGQSAYLRLVDIPDAVTFTSGSGQFLSNPVTIPAIPEPPVSILLLAGLGVLISFRGRALPFSTMK